MAVSVLKVACWILFVVILFITIYVSWLNRASEKVFVNVPTAGALAAVGVLVAVLFSLTSESTHREFVAAFLWDNTTLAPFTCQQFPQIRWLTDSTTTFATDGLAQVAVEADPALKAAKEIDSETAGMIYFEVLLRRIADVMAFAFHHTWLPKVTRFDLPFGGIVTTVQPAPTAADAKVEFLHFEQFAPLFQRPVILTHSNLTMDKIAVPPGTRLEVKRDNQVVEVRLSNPFVRVSITVQSHSGGGGLGRIGDVCGLKPDRETGERHTHRSWTVALHADFEPLRSGHPDMPKYKEWVETMFSQLRGELDAEERWRRLRAEYQFEASVRTASTKGQASP